MVSRISGSGFGYVKEFMGFKGGYFSVFLNDVVQEKFEGWIATFMTMSKRGSTMVDFCLNFKSLICGFNDLVELDF